MNPNHDEDRNALLQYMADAITEIQTAIDQNPHKGSDVQPYMDGYLAAYLHMQKVITMTAYRKTT